MSERMIAFKADREEWEKDNREWLKNREGPRPIEPSDPVANCRMVNDTTVEGLMPLLRDNPRGLLLLRDDLSVFFGALDQYKGKKSGGSSHYLAMYGGGCAKIDRKTGDPRTIIVPHASACIVGGIQPAILNMQLGREHRESGMLARFLIAHPPRKVRHWIEDGIPPDVSGRWAQLLDEREISEPTR